MDGSDGCRHPDAGPAREHIRKRLSDALRAVPAAMIAAAGRPEDLENAGRPSGQGQLKADGGGGTARRALHLTRSHLEFAPRTASPARITTPRRRQTMPFELRPLPYPKDALGEFMSAETLDFHHGKHHQAYVDKVNDLAEGTPLRQASLAEIVRRAHRDQNRALFNNSAQMWNHNFFWQCLAPAEGQTPRGALGELIDESFGSPEQLLSKLAEEAAGHFSNGWAWLVLQGGALRILSLHDADTPLVHEGIAPLLTLDVWEHAYYIDHRNDRRAFADAVLANIVNWEFVASNLDGQGARRADQRPE
jgi:Fe-Mn family superoxide dismutase